MTSSYVFQNDTEFFACWLGQDSTNWDFHDYDCSEHSESDSGKGNGKRKRSSSTKSTKGSKKKAPKKRHATASKKRHATASKKRHATASKKKSPVSRKKATSEMTADTGDEYCETKRYKMNDGSEINISELPVFPYRGPVDKECVICLTNFHKGCNVVAYPCLHLFHHTCVQYNHDESSDLYKPMNCPLCRVSV
jgi:hypothetical protein